MKKHTRTLWLAAVLAGFALLLTSIPSIAGSVNDELTQPTNLRFRRSATETLLLWDQNGAADSWAVLIDGEEVAVVYEQRFVVESFQTPHSVRARSGQTESAASEPLTFFPGQVEPATPDPSEPAEPTRPTLPPQPQPDPEDRAPETPVVPPTTGAVDSPPIPVDTGLVLGQDSTQPPTPWTKPELNVPYVDAVYGSTIRRVTSAEGTRFNRNTYSRRQAESPDGSRFFTYHGDAEYRVYDRVTTELLRTLDIHPDAEPQWHPTDSDLIRHIVGPNSYVGDLTLRETSVATGGTTVVADLTERVQATMPDALYMKDRAEGSPSADGNRYAWIVYNPDEQPIGIVSYDLANDTILGIAPIKAGGVDGSGAGLLDWVSASPTGDYVMAGYWNGTYVYDADLTNERKVNGKADHSDIALDSNGVDSYVYIDFSSGVDGGWLVSVDLHTLERTRLFDLYRTKSNTSVHVSGKAYDRPGWVVVSTYSCKVSAGWACHKVMAVELGGDHSIVNLAHTQNCGEDYWTETHAVTNRDLTRIYFNSDAGSCGIDAEVYELSVPPLP